MMGIVGQSGMILGRISMDDGPPRGGTMKTLGKLALALGAFALVVGPARRSGRRANTAPAGC